MLVLKTAPTLYPNSFGYHENKAVKNLLASHRLWDEFL